MQNLVSATKISWSFYEKVFELEEAIDYPLKITKSFSSFSDFNARKSDLNDYVRAETNCQNESKINPRGDSNSKNSFPWNKIFKCMKLSFFGLFCRLLISFYFLVDSAPLLWVLFHLLLLQNISYAPGVFVKCIVI